MNTYTDENLIGADLDDIAERIKQHLKQVLPKEVYDNWIDNFVFESISRSKIVIGYYGSDSLKDFEENYKEFVWIQICSIAGYSKKLEVHKRKHKTASPDAAKRKKNLNAAKWFFLSLIVLGITLAVALVAQIAILSLSKGTIQPARRGNALLPLWEMIHNGKMWMICIPSSIMYGAYYMIITLIGQKSLTDIFEMNCITAARIMLILTFFVAGMTMGVNALLRLFGNRRKATALLGGGCTVAGVIAGYLSFSGTGTLPLLIIAYFLLAIPGGFFALFCTIGKELNPPEDTGLAVAAINFMASSAVATFQYFGGMILGQFPLVEQHVPMEAYQTLFKVLAGIACCGIIPLLCLPETNIDSCHAH